LFEFGKDNGRLSFGGLHGVVRNLSPIGGIAIESVYLVTVARQSGVKGNPSSLELGLSEMPVMPEGPPRAHRCTRSG
jgi:hypothetical protein